MKSNTTVVEFVKFSQNGDVESMRKLLTKSPSLIMERTSEGWTALHQAASYNKDNSIEFLMSHGADVNARCMNNHNTGWTPLHNAAWNGSREAIKVLLKYKADLHARAQGAYNGKTPSELAVINKKEGIFKEALEESFTLESRKAQQYHNCVIVYIWLPRKSTQTLTDSAAATYELATKNTLASVGHVAMRIYRAYPLYNKYVSFWPINPNSVKQQGSSYVSYMTDCGTGRDADVKIPLFTLKIEEIIRFLEDIGNNLPEWKLLVSLKQAKKDLPQNCGTFVWKLLRVGGIKKNYGDHGMPVILGPYDISLRKRFKCDDGNIHGGIWDKFKWRKWIASPKLILHLTASAYELEGKLYRERDSWEFDLTALERLDCPSDLQRDMSVHITTRYGAQSARNIPSSGKKLPEEDKKSYRGYSLSDDEDDSDSEKEISVPQTTIKDRVQSAQNTLSHNQLPKEDKASLERKVLGTELMPTSKTTLFQFKEYGHRLSCFVKDNPVATTIAVGVILTTAAYCYKNKK